MAENTKIEWTDATVNFWWGCTKVGPGCDHCYAERLDRFGNNHWGAGAGRRKIKGAAALIHKLDNNYAWWGAHYQAGHLGAHCGPRRRVFIQSMSDIFDLEVPLDWFAEAWSHIQSCDRLDIQLVTKRISAVEKRLGPAADRWPQHAGLIVTVVNQAEADRDIPRLLQLKTDLGIPWVGLSCEPLLGPIDLNSTLGGTLWIGGQRGHEGTHRGIGTKECPRERHHHHDERCEKGLDWVIAGGESGPNARPSHPDWFRSLRDQCDVAGVPYLFKQWGEWLPVDSETFQTLAASDRKFEAMAEYVEPTNGMYRVGKKAAGRLLDGVEHNGFPAGRVA